MWAFSLAGTGLATRHTLVFVFIQSRFMNSVLQNAEPITTNEKLKEVFVALKFSASELKKKMIRQGGVNFGDLVTIWRLEEAMFDYNIDNVKSLVKAVHECREVIHGFTNKPTTVLN